MSIQKPQTSSLKMPEYTLVIIISNAGNKELSYSVNLDGIYEIYPEDYLQLETNQLPLRETLQIQLARELSELQLKLLINQWINEIKEGNRRAIIRLDLPPVGIGVPINQISLIQTTPLPSVTPPIAPTPKPPVKPPQFNSPAKPTMNTQINSPVANPIPQENQSNKPPEETKINTEIRTASNKADDI
ncbi:MAG: hypothetical protein WBB28_04225 [Crinalium sp.]